LDPSKIPYEDRKSVKFLEEEKQISKNTQNNIKIDEKQKSIQKSDEEYFLSLPFQLSKQSDPENGIIIRSLFKSKRTLNLDDLFITEDQHKLISIPKYLNNKNIKLTDFKKISSEDTHKLLLQIFELVMIFCYDFRTNEFEIGAESHWTISKLSSSISYYIGFNNIGEVARDVILRIQLFPLVRSKELGIESFIDAKSLFFYDRLLILKVLMEILKIFDGNSPYYLLNNLFIRPLIYFIQMVSTEDYKKFLKHVGEFKISTI
jgi:hypothetical protein